MNAPVSERRLRPDPAASIWILASIVLIAGTLAVLRPFERAIGAATERAHAAELRANAEEAALTRRTQIAALAARIRRDLRGVVARSDPGAEATGLLLDTQKLAAQSGVRIISIQPEAAAPRGPAPQVGTKGRSGSEPDPGEVAETFELRLRGDFRHLVSMIRSLSLMPTLARVLDARLERHDDATSHAVAIEATVRLATVRFAADRPAAP